LLPREQTGDTAGGIAAGSRLAAVWVEEAHGDGGFRDGRRGERDKLVAAYSTPAIGEGRDSRRGQGGGPGPFVYQNEVVAQSMHLVKKYLHVWRICQNRLDGTLFRGFFSVGGERKGRIKIFFHDNSV
jgi:hypothetical protein